MSVRFQADQLASPPAATNVETVDAAGGVRQVVTIGSFGAFGSETQLTAGQKTMAASIPVVLASDQSTFTTSISGSVAATQSGTWTVQQGGAPWSVSQSGAWTITANAGTNLNTSALALESGGNLATLAGAIIAQEATTSGVRGITAFGAVTTNSPTYTTGRSDALSLDTSGLLRASLKDTPSNTNNLNVNLAASAATVTISGTVTATQGGAPWSVTQSGAWTARCVGNAGGIFDAAGQNASAPANEIIVGGQFNSTPTAITSGNVSPLQLDSAGNLKVNLNANSFGTLTVGGTVTANQGGSNWSVNIAQVNGATVSTAASGIQKVGVVGNAGTTVDAGVGAGTAPTNMVAVGGLYNSTEIGPTTGQSAALQLDGKGRLRQVIMDAAGNTRGANVNSSNQLSVSVDAIVANQSVNVAQVAGITTDTNGGTKSAGTQRVTLATDQTTLTNLIGQVSVSAETGTVYNGTTALTPSFATVVASASGATSVVSAVASKRIRVLALQLVANGAVNVKWQSHTTPTDLTGLAYLAANGGYVLPFNPVGWFQTNSGEQLDINLSAAVAVGGSLVYVAV